MQPRGRLIVRWTILTVAALVLGTAIGAVYAYTMKEPVSAWNDKAFTDKQPPTAPKPFEPPNGATVSTSTPLLKWQPSVDDNPGFIYVLETSYDIHFSTVSREYDNIEKPEFQIPDNEPFAPGVKVYWRVFALDVGLNQGPYSSVFTFTPLAVLREAP